VKLLKTVLIALLSGSPAFPQQSIFKSDTNVVTVDVVAENKNGVPYDGLRREDVRVFENGKEQRVLSWEFVHRESILPSTLGRSGWANNRAYTGPRAQSSSCIILLDALNVNAADQGLARQYVLRTLRDLPSGERFALFILGANLQKISGFTDDLSGLENLLSKNGGQHASLLDKDPIEEVGDGINRKLLEELRREVTSAEQINALDRRVAITLDALTVIAQLAEQEPGRKNLIWVTSAFPLNTEPDLRLNYTNPGPGGSDQTLDPNRKGSFGTVRDYHVALADVSAKLARSRVAVYPIIFNSLRTDSDSAVGNPQFDSNEHRTTVFDANGSAERSASIATAQRFAEETGGRAAFNTNDITGAIARSVADAGNYYTLSYQPADKNMNGAYRRIEVHSNAKGVRLRYRRGYYAVKWNPVEVETTRLKAALNPEVPATLEIEVAASPNTEGKSAIEFAISPADLRFQDVEGGKRKAEVFVGYLAVPIAKDKKAMTSLAPVELLLNAEQWARAEHSGIVLTLRPQLSDGKWLVRAGVLDRSSRRVGTLDLTMQIGESAQSR
jgi:VWFA-related protein